MPAELAAPTAPPAPGPATLPAALARNGTGSPGPPTVARTRGPATHPAHGDEEDSDIDEIYGLIQTRLDDLELFAKQVEAYLAPETRPE